MKKADLLAKIATLLAATDHMPDDATISLVTIGLEIHLYSDFLPPEVVATIDGTHKYADAHGVTFGSSAE